MPEIRMKIKPNFIKISPGSARESKDWYFKSRHILRDRITNHRLTYAPQITHYLIETGSNSLKGVKPAASIVCRYSGQSVSKKVLIF